MNSFCFWFLKQMIPSNLEKTMGQNKQTICSKLLKIRHKTTIYSFFNIARLLGYFCLWLPAISTWRYPIRAYKWLGAMSGIFSFCKAPGPHSSISEEFLHSTILRPKKLLGSYPLLPSSQDEWSVLPDYNPWQINIQHQTFALKKSEIWS